MELPQEHTGPSHEVPVVSFSALVDDRMSIAAPEGELGSPGDEDLAALPPSGTITLPKPDPGMTAMPSRAAESAMLVRVPNPQNWAISFGALRTSAGHSRSFLSRSA